jgi:hypothetical protein
LDAFTISARIRILEFQIIQCESEEYCSVTPSTDIYIEDQPLERKNENKAEISGCCRQLSLLSELVCPGIGQSLHPSPERRMLLCTT